MNTRTAIQPPSTPLVLNLSFSATRSRFIASLSTGLRVFRTDNCLTTYQPDHAAFEGGIALAEALDDRYVAFVAGGRSPAKSGPNVVLFWDCVLDNEVCRFDVYEPILGLRLGRKCMIVVLHERTVVFGYQELSHPHSHDDDGDERVFGPNKVQAIHPTSPNPHAVASLSVSNELLVLPAQSIGQIQLIPLNGGSKRVLRAHNTSLAHLALSPSGKLLATASEQGTLIRVFDTSTLDQIAEFRRGVEKAIIFGLAFSDAETWLACTSDKGTVHIFDLRPKPPAAAEIPGRGQQSQHRKSQSHPTAHRLSANLTEKESLSAFSGRSSPSHQASVQEYYSLRPIPPPASPAPSHKPSTLLHPPPPNHHPLHPHSQVSPPQPHAHSQHHKAPSQAPTTTTSAFSAFAASPFAPRVLKDIRSIASCPFYLGDDPPYWQGGTSHSWTTTPGGVRKRVKNPVVNLPGGREGGRPVRGVVAFERNSGDAAGEDEGAVFHVLGGGTEGRWEVFDLVPRDAGAAGGHGGVWVVVRRGFRRFMTRQFVD